MTNRHRQMLLQALTLIDQVCKEDAEIELALGDSVWLELDNFLNPLTDAEHLAWKSMVDGLPQPKP